MINLLSRNWKGVISGEKKKRNPLCWQGLVLLDWPGRSGHVRSQSFGSVSHVSDPKLSFWGNFQMILHDFAWRSSKNTFFWSKKCCLILKRTGIPKTRKISNFLIGRAVCSLKIDASFYVSVRRSWKSVAARRSSRALHLGIIYCCMLQH